MQTDSLRNFIGLVCLMRNRHSKRQHHQLLAEEEEQPGGVANNNNDNNNDNNDNENSSENNHVDSDEDFENDYDEPTTFYNLNYEALFLVAQCLCRTSARRDTTNRDQPVIVSLQVVEICEHTPLGLRVSECTVDVVAHRFLPDLAFFLLEQPNQTATVADIRQFEVANAAAHHYHGRARSLAALAESVSHSVFTLSHPTYSAASVPSSQLLRDPETRLSLKREVMLHTVAFRMTLSLSPRPTLLLLHLRPGQVFRNINPVVSAPLTRLLLTHEAYAGALEQDQRLRNDLLDRGVRVERQGLGVVRVAEGVVRKIEQHIAGLPAEQRPGATSYLCWALDLCGRAARDAREFKLCRAVMDRNALLLTELYGENSMELAACRSALGFALAGMSEFKRAKEAFEFCVRTYTEHGGTTQIAVAKNNLVTGALRRLGFHEEGQRHIYEAIRIYEGLLPAAGGGDDSLLGYAVSTAARIEAERAEDGAPEAVARALTYGERGIAIFQRHYGDAVNALGSVCNLSAALIASRQRSHLERAEQLLLPILRRSDADDMIVAETCTLLGHALLRLNRPGEARELIERADAMLSAKVGPRALHLCPVLFIKAQILQRLGDAEGLRAALERSIEIAQHNDDNQYHAGKARRMLVEVEAEESAAGE